MIHDRRSEDIFAILHDVLDGLAPARGYRALFDKALEALREAAEKSPAFIPIDLPMAIADASGLPDEVAVIAAAASTLVWSGADLMDDEADGELTDIWAGVGRAQIGLVATNLLSTLPHLVVARLGDNGASSAYAKAVSRALFAMSDGQSTDLDSARAVGGIDDYLSLVHRKTGSEFALFASTPAILAQRNGKQLGAWVRFGFEYGSMVQIFSDTVSSIAEGPRNDLLHGKRTLPVLHCLDRIGDVDHRSCIADLDLAAAGDQAALVRTIQRMSSVGAVTASLERVELQRYRATRALPVRLAELPADHALRALLRMCSVV